MRTAATSDGTISSPALLRWRGSSPLLHVESAAHNPRPALSFASTKIDAVALSRDHLSKRIRQDELVGLAAYRVPGRPHHVLWFAVASWHNDKFAVLCCQVTRQQSTSARLRATGNSSHRHRGEEQHRDQPRHHADGKSRPAARKQRHCRDDGGNPFGIAKSDASALRIARRGRNWLAHCCPKGHRFGPQPNPQLARIDLPPVLHQ
jgi:hypothetical protein